MTIDHDDDDEWEAMAEMVMRSTPPQEFGWDDPQPATPRSPSTFRRSLRFDIRPHTRPWPYRLPPSRPDAHDDFMAESDAEYHRIHAKYPSQPTGYVVTVWSRLHEVGYRMIDMSLTIKRWRPTHSSCWTWLRDGAAEAVKANPGHTTITPLESAALDESTSDDDRSEILGELIRQEFEK